MNNFTSKPTSENLFNFKMHQDQAIWISSFIVNIILITLSMWLTASSTLYISKYSKKNLDRNRKRLLQMAILASALTLPRLLLTHLLFWIGYNDDEEDQTCEIVMDTSVICIRACIYYGVFVFVDASTFYLQTTIYHINQHKNNSSFKLDLFYLYHFRCNCSNIFVRRRYWTSINMDRLLCSYKHNKCK